jgi:hypothetical protein
MVATAAPWYGAREQMTETQADARVDAIVNDFFGPNTYPKADVISRNAKYAVHKGGSYAAGGKAYTEQEVRSATEEKIIGVIVSDMKDEARALVNSSPLPSDYRDTLVTHVGNQTKAELTQIFSSYSGHSDGYAKFLSGNRALKDKARTMIASIVFGR